MKDQYFKPLIYSFFCKIKKKRSGTHNSHQQRRLSECKARSPQIHTCFMHKRTSSLSLNNLICFFMVQILNKASLLVLIRISILHYYWYNSYAVTCSFPLTAISSVQFSVFSDSYNTIILPSNHYSPTSTSSSPNSFEILKYHFYKITYVSNTKEPTDYDTLSN